MLDDIFLIRAKLDLQIAKDAPNLVLNRQILFQAMALQLATWFEKYSSFHDFKMTTLLRVTEETEGDSLVVKYRQHLKIIAPGCEALQSVDQKTSFFYKATPYWLLGNGSFQISRNDPTMQALLHSERDSYDRLVKAFALSIQLDQAFEAIRQDFYLGEVL